MSVAEAALLWQLNGFSLIPIRVDGTKRPATRWREYIASAPTLEQVQDWWGNGHTFGIAVICGGVSGNLEMTEIEGRAFSYDNVLEIRNRLDEAGHIDLWAYLNSESGYVERSPSGGIHFLYRVGDAEVPGNTKLASREAFEDELTVDERALLAANSSLRFYRTLSETRGEGGYVIVAPTSGMCHPSGKAWELVSGTMGSVPVISLEQRNALHTAIRLTLDAPVHVITSPTNLTHPHLSSPHTDGPSHADPKADAPVRVSSPRSTADYPEPQGLPVLPSGPPSIGSSTGSLSPGDDFSNRTDWDDPDLLGGAGWTLTRQIGQYREWTRPGKDPRDGMSATTGREDVDRLYVFTTSTCFPTEQSISKFHAYALLHHGGDDKAAAISLKRRGFGHRAEVVELDDFHPDRHEYSFNDTGNSEMMWDLVGDKYRYINQAKEYWVFDGRVWRKDSERSLNWIFTEYMKKLSKSPDKDVAKWGHRCGSSDRVNSMRATLMNTPGCSVEMEEFDRHRGILNVHNGVLNLRTGQLIPHDASLMLTQLFNAEYRPDATCPHFEQFIQQVLPDAETRSYVQRALGYTLLGDADQRAMFLLYGPSGTGKSTLMETMRDVFGTYGQTAPAGTFKSKRDSGGPTADLHTLRGRRFISTSETAESTAFDEDLIKRLTGRDTIQSRALYQENVEWTPQVVLWLATNNVPRLSTDDDAIWRRLKPIKMETQFRGDNEIQDMARSHLAPERNGILNWLLAGLREYLKHGLMEPTSVTEAVQEQRVAGDSVARFIDDQILDGNLAAAPDGNIRSSDLYIMYQDWAHRLRETPVMQRRFTNRLLSHFPWLSGEKVGGQRVVKGLVKQLKAQPLWHGHTPAD